MSPIPHGYHAPKAREEDLERLAHPLPGARLEHLGDSVEGRPIHALALPSSYGPDAPAVLVCAAIHGVEYIGTEVALALLERAQRPELTRLLERAQLWVVPALNPDAYALTWERQGQGSLKDLRTNANGVDLNRNFPRPSPMRPVFYNFGGWRTGSDDPRNPFYRGEKPLSEPETRALVGLLERVPFVASANLHATMGTLIPPCVNSREDFRAYASLCGAFTQAQSVGYHRMASFRFDRFTGEQEDYQHHVHRTWAICVEHYPITRDTGRFLERSTTFERFNPPDPTPWIDNDIPGILAFFRACLDRGNPRP